MRLKLSCSYLDMSTYAFLRQLPAEKSLLKWPPELCISIPRMLSLYKFNIRRGLGSSPEMVGSRSLFPFFPFSRKQDQNMIYEHTSFTIQPHTTPKAEICTMRQKWRFCRPHMYEFSSYEIIWKNKSLERNISPDFVWKFSPYHLSNAFL